MIYLLEDDAAIRKLIVYTLKNGGMEAEGFPAPSLFYEAVERELPELILLDIYPAREEPIPGVTSEIIFKDVTSPEKVLLKRSELMDYLAGEKIELLVTVGAGDIDRFVGPIAEMLK